MELNKNILPAGLSPSMNFDDLQEPYILTHDEEKVILENELLRLQQHATWKMKGLAMTDAEILAKIKTIDWGAEMDKEAILRLANSNKHYSIWQQKQRDNEKQAEVDRITRLKEQWTATQVYKLMQWTSQNEFGKKLILNNENKNFIKALCYFISRDERFETELGLSLNKGLLIRGVSGLGKTFLVQCASKNELNPILILSMLEITGDVKSDGEYQIKMGNHKIIYLDDVGTEEATVNHFGTKISFFKNFIESYYLRNKVFNNLIISTNNSFAEIEEKYGFRVRSRMKDMFNIVDVIGKDMRG